MCVVMYNIVPYHVVLSNQRPLPPRTRSASLVFSFSDKPHSHYAQSPSPLTNMPKKKEREKRKPSPLLCLSPLPPHPTKAHALPLHPEGRAAARLCSSIHNARPPCPCPCPPRPLSKSCHYARLTSRLSIVPISSRTIETTNGTPR